MRATEFCTKPLPLIVSAKPFAPAEALGGLRLTIVGTGFCACVMVKFKPFDSPPPGAGVKTDTLAVPELAMSAAVICAVSCVLLTKVVVRGCEFQRTTESL